MLILIAVPLWVLLWAGVSIAACPLLGCARGERALWCGGLFVGLGGLALPAIAFTVLVAVKNRNP